jgi:RNA-binding protein
MTLSTKQKAYLRGLGQKLRPQLHVGHGGFTPGQIQALEDLFRGRELVKGKLLQSSEDDPKEIAARLASGTKSDVVGVVGKTFVLFRPNPDLKERIDLP